MNSIPGLELLEEEGWEIVRYDFVSQGECYVGHDVTVWTWDGRGASAEKKIIVRKIEKPKQYRPFANAAEYEPHRDRWVEYTSPNRDDYSMYQISCYSSQRVWLGPNSTGIEYREAFHCLKFDDGSPFGVEVAE